jgi:hypothetical protein
MDSNVRSDGSCQAGRGLVLRVTPHGSCGLFWRAGLAYSLSKQQDWPVRLRFRLTGEVEHG